MDAIKAWVYAGLRAGVQGIYGLILNWPVLGTLGLILPETLPEAVALPIVTVVGAAVIGTVVSLIRWAETRTGDGFGATLARTVAKYVMLGLGKYQPVFAQTDPSLTASSVTYKPAHAADEFEAAERVQATALAE